jgi:membrane associated rhomboid family serine protease
MARRGGRLDWDRILTVGDTAPRAVGGILIAMLVLTVAAMLSPRVWGLLCLDARGILGGQVWRLVTWVFPQGDPLTLLFSGFVLHWVGRDLAHTMSERRFLQAFFGYAAWAAAWTTFAAWAWAGADRPHVGAWPVVNALLVGWALSRPGAQLSIFGVVPMTAQVFAWILTGGTVLYALSAPTGVGEYFPHLSALALAWLVGTGHSPRRLFERARDGLRGRRGRSRGGLRSVDDKKNWMN